MANSKHTPAGGGQSQPNLSQCLIADASVFIGLTSIPLGEEMGFIRKMKDFFKRYYDGYSDEKGLCASLFPNNSSGKEEFQKYFYNPSMYYMFGAFDLAVLSLIEDFEFPVQTFEPCDPIFPPPEEKSPVPSFHPLNGKPPVPFAHRIIVGPAPRWNSNEPFSSDLYQRKLIDLAKETFLRREDGTFSPLPFIGICQIEVNTSFLVGAGTTFLRCLIKAIESLFRLMFRENDKDDKNTHIIILESYSWHELTLLVFSDSFAKIAKFVFDVRQMDLAEMGFLLLRQQSIGSFIKSYEDDWKELLSLPDIYGLKDAPVRYRKEPPDILKPEQQANNQSLINEICNDSNFPRNIPTNCRTISPFGTHVIFNTTTNLGFSTTLLEQVLGCLPAKEELKEKCQPEQEEVIKSGYEKAKKELTKIENTAIAEEKNLYLIRRWMAKAGHDISGAEVVTDDTGKENYVGTVGRSDFISPTLIPEGGHMQFGPLTSWQVVAKIIRQLLEINCCRLRGDSSEPAAGLLTSYSTVAVRTQGEPKGIKTSTPSSGHESAHEVREIVAFPYEQIREASCQLRSLLLPKAVTERLPNVIDLYNMGIQDNFTFSSFLEMRGYLEQLMKNIIRGDAKTSSTRKPHELAEQINTLINNFELGWHNRFSGGWRLGEVSDFNLEFKGGIQQLVSALQGAWSIFRRFFTSQRDALAVVGEKPGILTELSVVHLNLFDIFKPEFFAARICHEAAETLLEYLYRCPQSGSSEYPLPSLTSYMMGNDKDVENIFKQTPNLTSDEEALIHDAVHKEFFDQLFADICNYTTVFQSDAELYGYWWLGSFVVDPVNWEAPGEINREQLEESLLRMALTTAINGDVDQRVFMYWNELSSFGVNDINDLIDRAVNLAKKAKKAENGLPEVNGWFQAVRAILDDKLGQPIDLFDLSCGINRLTSRLRKGGVYSGGQFREKLRSQPHTERESLTWNHTGDLKYSFYEIIGLFYSYLKLLYQERGGGKNILERDDKGKVKEKDFSSGFAKLLFDPRGGTFTWDPGFRRKYFMWRNAFIMSLFDIAEKDKWYHPCLEKKEEGLY